MSQERTWSAMIAAEGVGSLVFPFFSSRLRIMTQHIGEPNGVHRGVSFMKSLDMLKQVDHSRKAAIHAAGHDGKLRNFAYTEELGECRETFSRLLHAVQESEIGVIMTPDAASLGIETSPGWMEAFIQAVKQHGVLIGDHGHDLVYDLREEEDEARLRALFSPEDYERERLAPRPLADAIA